MFFWETRSKRENREEERESMCVSLCVWCPRPTSHFVAVQISAYTYRTHTITYIPICTYKCNLHLSVCMCLIYGTDEDTNIHTYIHTSFGHSYTRTYVLYNCMFLYTHTETNLWHIYTYVPYYIYQGAGRNPEREEAWEIKNQKGNKHLIACVTALREFVVICRQCVKVLLVFLCTSCTLLDNSLHRHKKKTGKKNQKD